MKKLMYSGLVLSFLYLTFVNCGIAKAENPACVQMEDGTIWCCNSLGCHEVGGGN